MNCDCHCNRKCKMLGGLEQKIMDVLWSSKNPLKPSEVLAKIESKNAYTTIMTVLKRMADKKIVLREMKDRVYLYKAAQERCDFASNALEVLFGRLFCSYGQDTVTAFKKSAKKWGFPL